MSVRHLHSVALLLALGGLAGCSGGGSTASLSTSCGSPNTRFLCLNSCNLGCSSTGCARTDVAQNEIIILNFSEPVDPNSVNAASIRFRTASGSEPVGEFFVNGNTVEFVPTLSISGGQTFFGFSAGETYTMTLPGGDTELNVVRSTTNKPFEKSLTCTLQSTRGIVDLNGIAPRATLLVPPQGQLAAAPRDTEIVLEFNEMVDATPFLGGTQIPVNFSIRRNRIGLSGERECDPNSAPQPLAGTPVLDFDAGTGRSTLTFRPTQQLPGDVCIEIAVTDGVRDLSGRPAQPQQFTFRTVVVPLTDTPLVEEFQNADNLDADGSAATWGNGFVTFLQVGGDGRHGSFNDLSIDTGTVVDGKNIWELNCDNTIIPGANTTTGSPLAITDGRFFFTKMFIPANVRLRFTGTNPPVVTVAGRVDVLGDIDVSGQSLTALPSVPSGTLPGIGQTGGLGGVFGGNGGKGGDKVLAGATAANQGSLGQDAKVIAGHAYASTVTGSGGRGSGVFPPSGANNDITFGVPTGTGVAVLYAVSATAGGSGGSNHTAGGIGRVITNNHPEPGMGNTVGSQTAVAMSAATATTINVTVPGSGNPAFPWPANRYAGLTIELLTGNGAGQTRTIAGNTMQLTPVQTGIITVTQPWTTIPTVPTTFRILPLTTPPLLSAMGPQVPAGPAVQVLPFPTGSGLTRSSLHFLVGGAGGGGAGSHACMTLSLSRSWAQGCGGGGGGGAFALRAGRGLRVAAAGRLLARGGSAVNNNVATGASGATPAPGGGGAGGSIVLQSGNADEVDLQGLIDVRGGDGGIFNRLSSGGTPAGTPPAGSRVEIEGGDGGSGFVRLEVPGTPTTALLPNAQPAAVADNIAPLQEVDTVVSCTSKFYSTGLLFGPEYARYEVHAVVDGVPVVFSDDPAVSTQQAAVGAPVRALFQSARISLSTNEVLEIGPWRTSVRSTPNQTGIASDAFNGYRFMLQADRAFGANITIDKVIIVIRT